MILGVGIDLTNIEQIAARVQSDAFRRKVFTPDEVKACETFANSAEHYGGKFAAKEALMKAIGRGIRQEIWFTQIEVLGSQTGAPYLRVSGEAERIVKELGVVRMHISISHSDGIAVAMVILEG
jgi:holo-[acyl-carrier protein] synthase